MESTNNISVKFRWNSDGKLQSDVVDVTVMISTHHHQLLVM